MTEKAADEIERLRKLVHRWETCELVAESLCDMNNPESFCDTCKESLATEEKPLWRSAVVEAADEIEGLRSQVDALKSMIFPAPNYEYRYFVHPDAVSTFAKFFRGEFNE